MNTRPDDAHGPAATSRRKFLKGTSVALPAVMTLHSGTALAATSLGCGGQGNLAQNAPVLVDPATNPHDPYMRKLVGLYPKIELKRVSGEWRLIVATDKIPYYFFHQDGYPWRHVGPEPTSGSEIADAGIREALGRLKNGVASSTITLLATGKTYKIVNKSSFKKLGDAAALVNLNGNGDQIAVGAPPGTTGTYITSLTGACFHSLKQRGQLA